MRVRYVGCALLVVMLLVIAYYSSAFAPMEHSWKKNPIVFYIGDLDEPSVPDEADQPSWRAGFIEARKRWEDTPLDVNIKTVNASPHLSCQSNGRNEARWAKNNCGDAWGSRTLALTSRYFRGQKEMKEVDIMYNSNRSWGIYDGDRNSITDFVRVTVHELGHALGADHSDMRDAIMHPNISNTFLPSIDDLYGLSRGIGYGWGSHHKLKLRASGDGYIRVRPKVVGTVGMSKEYGEHFTDFSRFDCHESCSHWFQDGLRLRLVAVAAKGGSFIGWEGDSRCGSARGCNLTPLHTSKTVKAIFSSVAEQAPIAGADGEPDSTDVPHAPERVHVDYDMLANEVRIEWDEVAGAKMYKVLRGDTGSGDFLLIRKTAKTATVDRALADGQAYHYRVKSCNDYGCGKLSSKELGHMEPLVIKNTGAGYWDADND